MNGDIQFQYHLEELRSLRQEISDENRSRENAVMYGTLGNFVYAVTLVAQGRTLGPAFQLVAAWVPLAVTWLLHRILSEQQVEVGKAARYILALENEFAKSGLGWEHFLACERKRPYEKIRTAHAKFVCFELALAMGFGIYLTNSSVGLWNIVSGTIAIIRRIF